LSFVFIDIPGSFVDFPSAVAQRWAHFALLCGPSSRRVFGRRPRGCSAVLRETSRGVGIGDLLSLSFVFIDILALFAKKHFPTISFQLQPCHSRMAMSRRDRSGRAAQSGRTAPSAPRRRSKATSAPAIDLSTQSFVFIDILALFRQKQLSAGSLQLSAKPSGWRRPRCVGLQCPEGTGQAERHNLTARSDRAAARPILAYKLTFSLPRNFPVVEYLRVPTASLEGWRGPEHLREEPRGPNTRKR
jgi:hypothetical protein